MVAVMHYKKSTRKLRKTYDQLHNKGAAFRKTLEIQTKQPSEKNVFVFLNAVCVDV